MNITKRRIACPFGACPYWGRLYCIGKLIPLPLLLGREGEKSKIARMDG